MCLSLFSITFHIGLHDEVFSLVRQQLCPELCHFLDEVTFGDFSTHHLPVVFLAFEQNHAQDSINGSFDL